LREVHAGWDRMDPKTGFLIAVDIAFVDILKIYTDVFVDDEVFVVLAPLFIGANVLGWAEFDVVIPCRLGNCYCFSTACVYSWGCAIGRSCLISGLDRCDCAISGGNCSNRA